MKISFCISCRNRLWQIKNTLAHNLSIASTNHEIVLVDYGSTDGLREWVWSNFQKNIESKQLIFFRVLKAPPWSSPKAKNLAHRLATGKYLFNLDCDNFITESDLIMIEKAAKFNLPVQQFGGDFDDGTYGRIGLPKALFYKLGGYDESLLPMGAQDTDILNRILQSGSKLGKMTAPNKLPITNSVQDKVSEVINNSPDPKKTYETMNRINLTLSKFKNAHYGFQRLNQFGSYYGYLNGQLICIDGFNFIRRLKG